MQLSEFGNQPLRPLIERRLLYGELSRLPVAGDIIYKQSEEAILYFLLSLSEEEVMQMRPDFEIEEAKLEFEIGYIGNEDGVELLDEFKEISGWVFLSDQDEEIWESVTYENEEFSSLEDSEDTTFMPADEVTNEDVELSMILEDPKARELSIKIRRGGGLLASDIEERSEESKGESKIVDKLVDADLLSTEHVVICKQTSNQVNRVPSKEALIQLEEIGLQCSCGRPISEERNEELYVPTDKLQKLLTQSYWMTARLVRSLRQIGITNDSILLNLIEGSDEIDAFVDIEGTLVMIELKDSEFSMGHAYAFGGRIAQYKPSHAMIVSTRGVDEEVKEYFRRVEPEADLIYVDNLNELDVAVNEVGSEIRSEKASDILDALETTSSVSVPLKQSISEKLDVEFPNRRPRRGRRYYIPG